MKTTKPKSQTKSQPKTLTKTTRRLKKDVVLRPQIRASGEPIAGQVVLVVDCGSSGVRATIAEIQGQEHRILENLDFDADLTRVFQRGRLTREEIDQVLSTLEAIITGAAAYRVERRRLVATAALREAANGDVLIEAIKHKLGLDLEIIDPAEESRLYYQGYQALLQAQSSTVSSGLRSCWTQGVAASMSVCCHLGPWSVR